MVNSIDNYSVPLYDATSSPSRFDVNPFSSFSQRDISSLVNSEVSADHFQKRTRPLQNKSLSQGYFALPSSVSNLRKGFSLHHHPLYHGKK